MTKVSPHFVAIFKPQVAVSIEEQADDLTLEVKAILLRNSKVTSSFYYSILTGPCGLNMTILLTHTQWH